MSKNYKVKYSGNEINALLDKIKDLDPDNLNQREIRLLTESLNEFKTEYTRNKHNHDNKTILDKLGINQDNELIFDGNPIVTHDDETVKVLKQEIIYLSQILDKINYEVIE